MAQPQVVLMSGGFSTLESESETRGTRVFWDAGACPGKAAQALPKVGDAWDETWNAVFCTDVTKTPIGDDTALGFMYVVNYGTGSVTMDPLDPLRSNQISVSVGTGAGFDTFSVDPNDDTKTWYSSDLSSWAEISAPVTFSRLAPETTIQITARYLDTIEGLITSNVSLVGKINSAAMWGIPKGCILFMGSTATPVKVVEAGFTKIKWNRTYNYNVRHLPGVAEDGWQYVFYKGKYVRLADDTHDPESKDPYEYATLPDPL